jgi:peptide chain release factor 1
MKRAWLSPHRLQSTGTIPIEPPSFRKLTNHTATSSDDYIIPSLLERARSITKEHSELSNQLSNGYDAKIAKKVGELTPIVTALQLWEKANEVNSAGP